MIFDLNVRLSVRFVMKGSLGIIQGIRWPGLGNVDKMWTYFTESWVLSRESADPKYELLKMAAKFEYLQWYRKLFLLTKFRGESPQGKELAREIYQY